MKAAKHLLAALVGLSCACASGPGLAPSEARASARPSATPTVEVEAELGSTRGSVVAVRDPGELVYVASSLTEDQLTELASLAPNVRFAVGLEGEALLERALEADGIDAHLCTPELLRRAQKLRWTQAWSAGVDRYVELEELIEREDLVLTNMQGVHGPAIADHAMSMLLAHTRGLRDWFGAMDERAWNRGRAQEMTALRGRTMLVVGMGGIGSEVASRAKAFGMRVTATVRTARPAPDYVDRLGTADELDELLPEADVVAVCVPLTDETRGMFDAERIARMKPGAYLINIARGQIVDTEALLAALESGHLAGAGLDVTDPEPLPSDHPLWERADVLITPHVAARAEITQDRRWALFRENVRRFGAGEPLLNVVDKEAGY